MHRFSRNKKDCQYPDSLLRARDRNRTDTPLLAADFESAASTNFATRA